MAFDGVLAVVATVSAAVLKRVVLNKKGIDMAPRTVIAFVLLLAAAVVLYLMLKSVMCKTGTWEC